jgi:hypothetical protein
MKQFVLIVVILWSWQVKAQELNMENELKRVFLNLPITESSQAVIEELKKQHAEGWATKIPGTEWWIDQYKKDYKQHPPFDCTKAQLSFKKEPTLPREKLPNSIVDCFEIHLTLFFENQTKADEAYDALQEQWRKLATRTERELTRDKDYEPKEEFTCFYFDKTVDVPMFSLSRNRTNKNKKKEAVVIVGYTNCIISEK